MNFYGIRELSNNTKRVLSSVAKGNKAIITAILLNINEDNFETVLNCVQQMEAQTALSALQKASVANFPNGLSDEEIQAEIDAARKGD